MKKLFLLLLITLIVCSGQPVTAQDDTAKDTPHWLEGVNIPAKPADISPVVPLKIYMNNGEPIPATLTEDIPIAVVADTSLFDPDPPSEYNGEEIPNPRWISKAAITWLFIDWEKNENVQASSSQPLALNQMIVKPLNPTGKGAITCHAGRKMRYDLPEPGKTKGTFVNSSSAKDVRVLDITPPTCGLEISVKNGQSGTFWVAENPPNKYPLPKLADVYLTGALANPENPEEIITIQGIELGPDMIIQPEQAGISVPADAIITVHLNGADNYKLNDNKLKYGICNGAGGEPTPVSAENTGEIDLSKLKLPEEPYLYVDASDVAGNRQVLFVPLIIKN
jgi:hypothetical protein